MKKLAKLGVATIGLISSNTFAVNPVSGWYGNLLIGTSAVQTVERSFSFPVNQNGSLVYLDGTGQLSYSILGNLGIALGYRCEKYRGEAQFLYNNNPYKEITFTGDSQQIVITTGANSISTRKTGTTSWNLDGSTTTMGIMANGYYDFLPNNPRSNIAPYVGLGVGYAYTSNSLSMTCVNNAGKNCVVTSGDKIRSVEKNIWSVAGQGIAGVSYFLDDFTTFGLDFRYFSTVSEVPLFNTRNQFISLNFLFNGTFDAG